MPFLAPKATIYELAVAYASKFDAKDSRPKIPLSVSIGLPVTVFVVLTIGFIWWKENVRVKSREERLSFIKIKNLRELDNFSSLEHMEKFSSRMETKVNIASFNVIFSRLILMARQVYQNVF